MVFRGLIGGRWVALIALVEHLRGCGYQLLDIQWVTGHLVQFGALEVSKCEYLERLEHALELDVEF